MCGYIYTVCEQAKKKNLKLIYLQCILFRVKAQDAIKKKKQEHGSRKVLKHGKM